MPSDNDCYDAEAMRDDAVMHATSRNQFQQLCYLLGLYSSIDLQLARRRAALPALPGGGGDAPRPYTYWDYRAGCWAKGHGLRIDHILLHPLVRMIL